MEDREIPPGGTSLEINWKLGRGGRERKKIERMKIKTFVIHDSGNREIINDSKRFFIF